MATLTRSTGFQPVFYMWHGHLGRVRNTGILPVFLPLSLPPHAIATTGGSLKRSLGMALLLRVIARPVRPTRQSDASHPERSAAKSRGLFKQSAVRRTASQSIFTPALRYPLPATRSVSPRNLKSPSLPTSRARKEAGNQPICPICTTPQSETCHPPPHYAIRYPLHALIPPTPRRPISPTCPTGPTCPICPTLFYITLNSPITPLLARNFALRVFSSAVPPQAIAPPP